MQPNRITQTLALAAACCLCLSTSSLCAAVTFDWVTIGNPGNEADQLYPSNNPHLHRFGSVDYIYRISKYEVTNDQYRDFLNAVDATGTNPNLVYNEEMGSAPRGGIAFDAAAANGSKYSSKTNMGNKPVNFVNFFHGMQFVNWLENGQPTDGSGTESGVYTIDDGLNETRALGASFFIPSENEWYKAAYYDPRSTAQGGPPGDDNYWYYASSSDNVPTMATANATGDISNPGTNVVNFDRGADWNGQDGNVTTVGTAGAASTSFYGTFDQTGNVWEWNEDCLNWPDPCPEHGLVRGGAWITPPDEFLTAGHRVGVHPDNSAEILGIRVASILTCDFDGLNGCDINDIDLLVAEIVAGTHDTNFDLTGDREVTLEDVTDEDVGWLRLAGEENLGPGLSYLPADITLDRFVDGLDFIEWNASKFLTTGLWSLGDLNADGFTDGLDFIIWNEFKFMSSDSVSTVPEPGTGVLSFAAAMCLGVVLRRR